MTITFYKCTAENRHVDKKNYLIEVNTIEGTLRQKNVSVKDPIITIAYSSEILGANYAYIPEYKRYYYINGYSNIVNGIMDVSMHVDVLMSFKDEFLQNEGYIDTSLGYGNFYLNDPNTPVQQNTDLFVVRSFDSPFVGSSVVMNCLNTAQQHLSPETTE